MKRPLVSISFARALLLLAALAVMVPLGACRTTQETPTPMPALSTPPATIDAEAGANPGSIFNEGEADYLFSDNRARRIGDIVLVNVVENSNAKNKAETDTNRDSTMGLTVNNLFGTQKLMGGAVGSTPLLKGGMEMGFKGDGETKREGFVTATVGARVVNMLPGGAMQIEGARQVRVNDETMILVVRGLVRARDIQPDNSIYSTHLADAQIEYYGEGIVAEKQKPGWLVRILDNISPF